MKSMIVVAFALVAVAAAVPVDVKEPAKIIRSNFDQQPDGPYQTGFETEDGTSRQEQAEWKQVVNEEGKTVNVLVVRGQYSYTNSEGNHDTVSYIADETGFHAEGPSIPKPARR